MSTGTNAGDKRFRSVKPTAKRIDDPEVLAWSSPKVYYLWVGQYVKIGYTTNLRSRLRAYPPDAELLAVIPFATKDVEARHHQDMRVYRAAGREWFYPSDELMQRVAELVAEHGEPSPFWSPWKKPAKVPFTAHGHIPRARHVS